MVKMKYYVHRGGIKMFTLSLIIILSSCSNNSRIHFYSPDKSECITVITNDSTRYFIDGKYRKVPDTNYVKLSIKDANSISDNLYICWDDSLYHWDAINENAVVIYSKLDSTKFHFSTKLPEDNRGIPCVKKYREENCSVFSFYLNRLSPDRGAIVENHRKYFFIF